MGVKGLDDHMSVGLLEAAPDAMVCVAADGRVALINAAAERLFGYRREELTGQPVELLVPDADRAIHPRHRAGYVADPRPRPMGAGKDLAGRRKDGSTFPAEISLSAIDTDEGILITAAVRDVTERLRAEARFLGLLEAAPDAMVCVDQATGGSRWSTPQAERLFGYRRENWSASRWRSWCRTPPGPSTRRTGPSTSPIRGRGRWERAWNWPAGAATAARSRPRSPCRRSTPTRASWSPPPSATSPSGWRPRPSGSG